MTIRRKFHRLAYTAGLVLSGILISVVAMFNGGKLHSHGPMNSGHSELKCAYCHIKARGSMRQQLQANVKFVLGQRMKPVSFGFESVNNSVCIACHQRPDDNHPVYRFVEPKFSEVRKKISPHQCISCHMEHTKRRVTINMDFCRHCHDRLNIKKDPISIPHSRLVKQNKWRICMGCHDFHGNHYMQLKEDISKVYSINTIDRYFSGSPSPYSKRKKYQAKKTL